MNGFFGPGAGSFFLIGIHLLLKAGLVKASGTAKAFNIAANLGAVTTFASAGTLYYSLALPCAVASIFGQPLRRNLCRQNRSDARTQHALLRVSHAADFSDNAIRYLIRTRGTRWFTSQRSS